MSLADNSTCYTIDIEKSFIQPSGIAKIEEGVRKGLIQLFKLKNGKLRLIACLDSTIYEEIKETQQLFLKKGVNVDILEDQIIMIPLEIFVEEINNG